VTDPTDVPRPTPDGSLRAEAGFAVGTEIVSEANDTPEEPAALVEPVVVRDASAPPKPPPRGQLTRVELQPSQVVAAAGSAIVTAARVGRLLSRSGWRIARQLPGARTVEREAQRLQTFAATESRRILQMPPPAPGRPSSQEQRAAEYIRTADPGTAPLRSAMSELLERSVEATRTDSREYLYGTIISQLVPDEARILAALADGTRFAAADVVQKQRRGASRVLLANASSVGRQAGLVSPDNVPTYLSRLHGFGLVEFGPEDENLGVQYDILSTDATIQNARETVESRRRSSVKIVRKTVGMSAFGREFWAASDPARPALPS
jgi:Abortive infection alpha